MEEAVRGIDTPWWYFVLSAALFASLVLTQLLGDKSTTFMMAVGMAIVALNLMAARGAGVMGSGSHNLGFVTAVFLILVVIVGSLVWFGATGEVWTVVTAAAAAAVLMLIGGWLYRRKPS
ncbi:MAG TPA: hypothetical protein VES60_14925 [Nakamurella sp.]|nr:hypothetical protein [Nakamurella sp.]